MNAVEHCVYRLRNARVQTYPFPHFYAQDVFPWDFYKSILAALPDDAEYESIYKHRVAAKSVPSILDGFNSQYFAQQVMSLFEAGDPAARYSVELRFIRDEEGYAIGPHTDAPWKVISLLFYLPTTSVDHDCGTSIFVPDDHKKICPGGPHHSFDGFSEVFRAPYVPNVCFGFLKAPDSWHGVLPIEKKITRNVLLFNIYNETMRK